MIIIPEKSCLLCCAGYLLFINEAHKCLDYGAPIYALPTCSKIKFGHDDIRVCFMCWALNDNNNDKNIVLFGVGNYEKQNLNPGIDQSQK